MEKYVIDLTQQDAKDLALAIEKEIEYIEDDLNDSLTAAILSDFESILADNSVVGVSHSSRNDRRHTGYGGVPTQKDSSRLHSNSADNASTQSMPSSRSVKIYPKNKQGLDPAKVRESPDYQKFYTNFIKILETNEKIALKIRNNLRSVAGVKELRSIFETTIKNNHSNYSDAVIDVMWKVFREEMTDYLFSKYHMDDPAVRKLSAAS